jgi:ketosteroid isomerase-like protein
MKKTYFYLLIIVCFSCKPTQNSITTEKQQITTTLNSWHQAAANAQFDNYFNLMTSDGIFIGTDPTENWQNEAFKAFSKPYFDKGKAWNFTAIERNIYFSTDQKTAWFDELLDTQMKICRGSGVLLKQNGQWKIAHYVLSIAIPNDHTDEVVKIKTQFDDALIKKLKTKQ